MEREQKWNLVSQVANSYVKHTEKAINTVIKTAGNVICITSACVAAVCITFLITENKTNF